jgi:hypothetical protein
MRFRTLVAVAPLVAFGATALCAQQGSSADVDAAVRTRLKSDLRNLVTAQEAFYAGHSTYSDQIDALSYRPSNGSLVSLTATQNNAWAAVAQDASDPTKSCVIFINLAEKYRPKTAKEKRAPDKEGAPLCDGDEKPGT